jgi:SAM-dependent methyltransferase
LNKNNESKDLLCTKLTNMGISGFNIVVDAACGNGYWLPALANLNKYVIGFDNYKPALLEAAEVTKDISNAYPVIANMTDTFLKRKSTDVIFCADSMNFINPTVALRNFYEVLRVNGLVYASVNGFGWALYCIFHRGIIQGDYRKINMGVMMIVNTFIRKFINKTYPVSNSFYTAGDLKGIAQSLGYEVVYAGLEGSYNNKDFKKYPSRFEPYYLGFKRSLEIILKKQSD